MSIPLVNLPRQHEEMYDALRDAIEGVIERGDFVLGQDVEAFEREFANYCEVKHCIGVGSGLDALTLALMGLGIGPGDEVITVANTFIATAIAVRRAGATPVLIDHDPETYTMDPRRIFAAITSRTRAILPVHLYGHAADMDAIGTIADEHGIVVVEDACQAHGARYKGRRCGSMGDAAAFSFYPGKNLGAMGDGGAIVTDRDELAAWLRAARNYGSTVKHRHTISGINSRLDTMQAAVLRVKLRELDEWNDRRCWLASRYCELLADLDGVVLPTESPDVEHAYHLFVIRCPQRDQLLKHLKAHGVDAGIHYPIPIHRQGDAAGGYVALHPLPNTESSCDALLSLPICPYLSEDDLESVVEHVKSGLFRVQVGATHVQMPWA